MYALCDVNRPLICNFRCSLPLDQSLALFSRLHPDASEVVVYRDIREKGNPSDYQFICYLNKKQFSKFKSNNKK